MQTAEERKEYRRRYYQENKARLQELGKKYYLQNSDRIKAQSKAWKKAHKGQQNIRDANRNAGYSRRYGITLTDYNNMFVAQAGKCNICRTHQSELKKALRVDHCHQTGKVRGLLCHNCNIGIGMLQDDPDIIKSALIYIKNSTN